MNLIDVHNLHVSFPLSNGTFEAVKSISFSIAPGRILGLIGESGSGKSVASQSLTQLIPSAQLSGEVMLTTEGHTVDILKASPEELRRIRQRQVAYIFQEPMTALNPLVRCGKQILESSPAPSTEELNQLLHTVELFDTERIARSFPHELSGGQRQRVMIAMALAKKPQLLIADEITTALDVSVQSEILNLLRKISRSEQTAVLFITHDLLSLNGFADEIAVMYQGNIVEMNTADRLLTAPQHPYTQALLASRATYQHKGKKLLEINDLMLESKGEFKSLDPKEESVHRTFSDRVILEIENLNKSHFSRTLFKTEEFKVLNDVSFQVNQGDILGIVGESGSGKSTIAKIILSLWEPTSGRIAWEGKSLTEINDASRSIQMVFQDPFSSLNPKHRVGQAIAEVARSIGDKEAKKTAMRLLTEVGLSSEDYKKYPHEFSGGQRQRVCIAKSLAKQPKLIVLDEAVSALDVSVQAKIINLLNELQQQRNLTFVLISHDINVVSYFCNKIVVLKDGRIVETGPTDKLIEQASSQYTQELFKHNVI